MVTVSEINNADALAEVRDLWRELWWRTPGASFFQSVEWFENSWRRLTGSKRLRVLVVSVSDRPVGIVPLAVRRVSTSIGALRVLGYPLDGYGFHHGPLGANPSLSLDAALKHIASTRRNWDLIEIKHVNDGLDRGRTPRMLRHHGFKKRGTQDDRAVVSAESDWVHYWESRSSELRLELPRCERQLAELGDVEYVRHRPEGAPVEDDNPRWELFNELEIARFENETGAGSDPNRREATEAFRQFLREMHQTAAGIAAVDFNVLRLAGRPVAWAYNYRCDGRIEMQMLHALAEWEPMASIVLLGRMLRDGFRRGDEKYVLDAQTSRKAAAWQTGRATSCRYWRFSPLAVRAQAFRVAEWLRSHAVRTRAPQRAATNDRRRVPRIIG